MVIVYNPPTGAKISEKFKSDKLGLSKPIEQNMMQYCEPELAEALVSTYPFLQIVTPQEAQSIQEAKDKPEGEFKCDQCEYSFTAKIALLGHQRSHKKADEPVLDIPVVETVKVEEVKQAEKIDEIPDDLKGVGWYGEGVKEENGSSS